MLIEKTGSEYSLNLVELGNILSEFENRLSYLENSQPIYYDKQEQDTPPVRPVVRVTYQVNGVDQMPYFGELQKQINLLKGRLSKYFENKSQPF